jgi:putative two-component system hydrogenase maturation factor HypX/HoxX
VKLPATRALELVGAPLPPELDGADAPGRVTTEQHGEVAVIRFPFLNGAVNVARARALEAAIRAAAEGPARAILLAGGPEFWSNGIDLASIEAADSPAEASMETIEAMDDVCLAILEATGTWTVAAMRGNAGAGGVFMALAADEVLAREGTVLNPHYRNMGNLHGSEYWTYLLPRRLGAEGAVALMQGRMPLSAAGAARAGLVDAALPGDPDAFLEAAIHRTAGTVAAPDFEGRLAAKVARRRADEAEKPLAAYRAEALERMRLNFFGFDTSYHVARHDFVTRTPKSRTPLHLARHRRRPAVVPAAWPAAE